MSSQTDKSDRHIIWSDIHLDLEDWRDDLQAEFPAFSKEKSEVIQNDM